MTPVNDKPIADDATVVALEDIEKAITLTGDDGDPDVVQTLKFILTSLPASGTLSETSGGPAITQADLGASGLPLAGSQLFFLTDQDDTTQQTFQFFVKDDGGTANGGEDTSDPATVTIDVTPVNDKPIADDATVVALEDVETAITLTGDDGDPDVVQTLTFVLTSLPASGTLSETPGGTAITQADLALPAGARRFPVVLLDGPGRYDSADVPVPGRDNGGTAIGGVDTSAVAQVTVNITPLTTRLPQSMTSIRRFRESH